MIAKSRLHIYPNKGPKTRAYILGERQALRALSEALRKAADGVLGSETVTLYGSDGHDYEIFITRDLLESEWQTLKDPTDVSSIKTWEGVKLELQQRQFPQDFDTY